MLRQSLHTLPISVPVGELSFYNWMKQPACWCEGRWSGKCLYLKEDFYEENHSLESYIYQAHFTESAVDPVVAIAALFYVSKIPVICSFLWDTDMIRARTSESKTRGDVVCLVKTIRSAKP